MWKRTKRRLMVGVAGVAGAPSLRLLARSWKLRVEGGEHWDRATEAADGKRPVFCCWHRDIPAGAALHRNRGLTAMISRHHDGELIARIIERLGYRTARGSSSEGGMAAVRAMLREVEGEQGLVVTPDGPRGPAEEVAAGAVFLAALTGRHLVATGFAAERFWRARSWDRMIVPKPGTRLAVAYLEGMAVPREVLKSEESMDEIRERFRLRLERAHARAGEMLAHWGHEA